MGKCIREMMIKKHLFVLNMLSLAGIFLAGVGLMSLQQAFQSTGVHIALLTGAGLCQAPVFIVIALNKWKDLRTENFAMVLNKSIAWRKLPGLLFACLLYGILMKTRHSFSYTISHILSGCAVTVVFLGIVFSRKT